MNNGSEDIVMRSSAFAWVALVTGFILLVPLTAMQFTPEVHWDGADFAVMGLLLFGAGSAFVLISRKVARTHRLAVGAVLAVVVVYLWAELSVGIFTNLGS